MKQTLPRVAAVHDLSCIGRCSLTVIMPILSVMGIQACPLPTALLSTHFGGFSGVVFTDLSNRMPEYAAHWKQEGMIFDCIYSGFLASEQQIAVVAQFIDDFSDNRPLVLVDPVMGDHGKLYSLYTPSMQQQMKTLVNKADIITPNYTEACFLLGETYRDRIDDPGELDDWLIRLSELGPSAVIITGVPLADEQLLTIGNERKSDEIYKIVNERIPASYPGTGDAFASVLAGALLSGDSLSAAMQQAIDFVSLCIRETYQAATPAREGVLLEQALPWLCRRTRHVREDD